MIYYKPFPVFDITEADRTSWDISLGGELLARRSPTPMTDCALLASRRGFTGTYRVRRPESGRAYDWQGLIAAVAGDNIGTGVDSPAYGIPRNRPEKASSEVEA